MAEPSQKGPTLGVAERRANTSKENAVYMAAHPEVDRMLEDLVTKLLAEKPEDALGFMRREFGGKTAEQEFAEQNVSVLVKQQRGAS